MMDHRRVEAAWREPRLAGGGAVAEHTLEVAPGARLCAAAIVAGIGADGHPVHVPHVERMAEQQQLRLGVDGALAWAQPVPPSHLDRPRCLPTT
jgi:hypothetical protein